MDATELFDKVAVNSCKIILLLTPSFARISYCVFACLSDVHPLQIHHPISPSSRISQHGRSILTDVRGKDGAQVPNEHRRLHPRVSSVSPAVRSGSRPVGAAGRLVGTHPKTAMEAEDVVGCTGKSVFAEIFGFHVLHMDH